MTGKPENIEDFERVLVEGIELYIHKDVLEEYVKNNLLIIVIEGYGRFQVEFVE